MSRLTASLAATLCAAIHASAFAQGTGPSSRGEAPPHTVAAIPVLPVLPSSTAQTPSSATEATDDEDDDASSAATPSDFDVDLRVVSMTAPTLQTTSSGATQQVMLVTIANFGREAAASASLFLDQDTHGRPVGEAKLPLPRLAPGAKVTIPVPITTPPDLQGQVCFTARLELSAPKTVRDETQ